MGSTTASIDEALLNDATGADRRNLADFRRAERHSRRVRRLKIWLPLLAVAGIAGFVGWSYLSIPTFEGIALDGAAISDGKLVMANPKLDGFTRDNLPYAMTAARAVQDLKNTGIIELEKIDARLPVSSDNTAAVVAERGVYDNTKNTLTIDTPITVTTTDGMVANLRSANLDIASGRMNTADPVEITLDGSRIEADSMTISDNGKVVLFEHRVRVDVEPKNKSLERAESGAVNASN